MNDVLEIKVMGGIGDLSWIYSKLKHINRDWKLCVSSDIPKRGLTFLERLPALNNGHGFQCYYGNHRFEDILVNEQKQNFKTWEDIEKSELNPIYLQNNVNFIKGERIESWLPDLPTDYHYDMITTEEEKQQVNNIFKDIKNPIGIFMANKIGQRAWKGWDGDKWFEFISLINKDFKDKEITFVLIGTHYDQQLGWELEYYLDKETDNKKIKYINLINQTQIGTLIETIKHLKYLVGFQSGVNVLGTVLNIPGASMWPEEHWNHLDCWCDPEMIKNGTYKGLLWDEPLNIFRVVYKSIKNALGE